MEAFLLVILLAVGILTTATSCVGAGFILNVMFGFPLYVGAIGMIVIYVITILLILFGEDKTK